ncbi:hypothetical protein GQ55_7G230400 [Panicum hallii var. hallii]|uniref:Uncharacterized protein n=1 Tax=Panicum hallii var. hallii TaxID=1504633 RepID=A0A2T7CY40_9POAL|nr:hypothetical protein GQ55_7G230400 [Panicum hallii var. hallii]
MKTFAPFCLLVDSVESPGRPDGPSTAGSEETRQKRGRGARFERTWGLGGSASVSVGSVSLGESGVRPPGEPGLVAWWGAAGAGRAHAPAPREQPAAGDRERGEAETSPDQQESGRRGACRRSMTRKMRAPFACVRELRRLVVCVRGPPAQAYMLPHAHFGGETEDKSLASPALRGTDCTKGQIPGSHQSSILPGDFSLV